MSINDRLKKYIKYRGMRVTDFENSIFVSNGYVSNIKKTIGLEKLELIIELYSNLDIIWLLTGEGEMLKNENITKILSEPIESYSIDLSVEEIIDRLLSHDITKAEAVRLLEQKIQI
ncbi:MAG: hypothetical protein ABI207_06095 [Crocinitomicaceae bacterium]